MAAKCVRADFNVANAKGRNSLNSKSGVDSIVDRYFTGERFNKCIQHLNDEGKISYAKSDLQFIIPEFFNDLMDEKKEEMISMIMGDVFKSIKKRANRYVVKEYVNYLVERQFSGDNEKND